MDSYMRSYDFYGAGHEVTIFHDQNLSGISKVLPRHQSVERDQTVPNWHEVGTPIGGHALNHGVKIGREHQYQSTSTLEVGTKTPRVNETGSSYEVNAVSAPMVQQLPIEQNCMPVPSECLDSPNVADQAKLKRKASEVARDPAERKKESDKAYRQRCKEKKMKTEKDLAAFTEEAGQLKGIVQAQNETVKQLEREVGQLKGQLANQRTVVEVLSKQLEESKHVDVQRENEQLKYEKDLLINQINNPSTMGIIIQLEAKIKQLEREVRRGQLIMDALFKK